MKSPKNPLNPAPGVSKGFALVVSLTMLVLLTIIAVGLLSLSAITLRTASQTSARATAEANARLALMIAIGELQKYTGADTRITAPSDIIEPGSPPIVGVWKSWEGLNHDSTGRPVQPDYTLKNPSRQDGRFLKWLISTAIEGENQSTPSALAFSTEAPDRSTVPLLAEGSLGSNPGQIHVIPQLVEENAGAYAWWVSAENQKARLAQPYEPRTNDAAGWVEMGQSHSVPNPGAFGLASLVSDPEAFRPDPADPKLGRRAITLKTTELIADDNSENPQLNFHALSTNSVGLLTNVATGGWRKDLSILSEKWDDIYAAYPTGRLPLFRLSPESGETSQVVKPTVANHTPSGSTFYPWSGYSQLGAQRWPNTWHAASSSWQSLVNFATSYKNFTYSSGVAESPFIWSPVMKWRWQGNPNDATNQEFYDYNNEPRLHPVLARFQFLVYLRAYPDLARPGRYGLEMLYSPVVTLWNPYNVRLSIDNPGPTGGYGVVIGGQRSFPGAFAAEPLAWFPNGPETIPLNRYRLVTNGNFQFADTNGNFNNQYDTNLPQNFIYQTSGDPPSRANSMRDIRTWGVNLPRGELSFEPGEVRMFSSSGEAEIRFGGAAFGMVNGFNPGAPTGIAFTIRGGNVGPNDYFWFSLRGETYTQPFRFRSPGRGFHLAFGMNTGTSYTGGGLYNGLSQEMMSSTALTNGDRAAVYWPDDDFEPHGFSVGEIASVPAMPIYSITLGPRFTIGMGIGTQQSRPTKGFLQSDPLAGVSLVDPGVDNSNSHPANANFELSYNTLAFGSSLTPNLSDREGHIVTGFQSGDGLSRLITHELPLRPMASLIELQAWNPRGKNPMPPFQSHLIGNSDATPMIPSDAIVPPVMNPNNPQENLQHDDAYCANHLLFDDWFVSSIAPQAMGNSIAKNIETAYTDFLTGQDKLSNRSYQPIPEDSNLTPTQAAERVAAILNSPTGDGWLKVASRLEVEGMFNVNSTSVEAWRAILGHAKSREEIALYGQNGIVSTQASNGHSITRGAVASDVESGTAPALGGEFDNASEFTGFRSLTDDQIDDLAEKIVEQVRVRGPFLSLAEFVNRQLSENDNLALAGAVQTAINNLEDDPMAILRNPVNSLSDDTMSVADDKLDGVDYQYPLASEGSSAHGAPSWIRQADVLRPIAPILSARDDTFTIRTYGDARDSNGNIVATAWCEAVVKRTRDFCDAADSADSIEPPTAPINITFGRKYQIVSFRWLNSSEV